MTDMQWHDLAGVMRDAIGANDKLAFERARAEAFAKPNVVRKKGMAYEANRHGHAFQAMGCTDMMAVLAEASVKWNLPEYAGLGAECARTVLTRWSEGGLRSDRGAWLHSRTSETEDTPGGTLNQALIAARNMAKASVDFGLAGMTGLACELRDGALSLVAQLADKDAWPNWSSFVATKSNRPVARSWLAYAVSFETKGIYFLTDKPEKNGNYSIKALEVFAVLHDLLGFDMGPTQQFMVHGKKNIFDLSLKTFRLKRRDGWYAASRAGGNGNFSALSEDRTPPPPVARWLKQFLKHWSKA